MSVNSQRANKIQAHINAHNCSRGLQKVVINGKVEQLESYLLPTQLLQYNHDNRRFNLEIMDEERKLKRRLDPESPDDVKRIKELLLKDSENAKNEARKLKDNLLEIGEQTEVAAVSYDGIVINGNRRMATLEELYSESPNRKWENLWAVILPKDISEKDLWRIEAGLQLSKEKVADYGPVNNLLMIAEGKRAGLSITEIASSMYGWNERQVKDDLDRLDLIDTFLTFLDDPGNYGIIKKFRLHEHFIDLQKGLVQRWNDLGHSRRDLTPRLETAFLYLKGSIEKPDKLKLTHYDVRDLCKILIQNDVAAQALNDTFTRYDDVRHIPIDTLVENFDKASDIKKNREDKEKPGKLIEKAITALSGIDRENAHYKGDEDVKRKLAALSKLVQEMENELGVKND